MKAKISEVVAVTMLWGVENWREYYSIDITCILVKYLSNLYRRIARNLV